MDYLVGLLSAFIADEETARLVLMGMMAATLFSLGMGIILLVMGMSNPVKRRMDALVHQHPHAKQKVDGDSFVKKVVEPVGAYVLPQKEQELSKIKLDMIHAGFRDPNAVMNFYAARILLALGLPALLLTATQFIPELEVKRITLMVVLSGLTGLIIPQLFLSHMIKLRKQKLRDGFPDALDLLVVCVESGLGLASAIQRVGIELEVSHPELAEELALVNAEMKAGVNRMEALRNLTTRTGLEEIRGLVALLEQSARFGTSMADTLRVYSEEFRDKRMQKAEEQGAKIGTKMIFPLVVCMWPSFFLVAIGPGIIKMLAVFAQY